MNFSKHYLLIIFFSTLSLYTQGQNSCGFIKTSDFDKTFLITKSLKNTPTTRSLRYVPIQFHLIGKDDGTGHLKQGKLLKELCHINEQFSDQEIIYYIHNDSINYINSSGTYDNPNQNSSLLNSHKVANVLNVFIVNNISGLGYTLGYYDPMNDLVVTIKSEINKTPTALTLCHEFGHYFNLRHTYLGVGNEDCPMLPYYNGQELELVDGSNCENVVDFFCDTPPDPGFGFGANLCEEYEGPSCDPNGDSYYHVPDVQNFMSNFYDCVDYHFSGEQVEHMGNNLTYRQTINLNLVNNNSSTEIVIQDVVINSISTTNSTFTAEWEAVPNATHYFVEISRTSAFSTVGYNSLIVSDTNVTFSDLTVDKKYYIRVLPYNQLGSCNDSGEPSSSIVSIDNTIRQINSWTITPNPNTIDNNTKMFISSSKKLDITINISDIAGRNVLSSLEKLNIGNNNIYLNTNILISGVYFISLEFQGQTSNQKLIIQ